MAISNEMKNYLMAQGGMTKQQVESSTAAKCIEALMDENSAMLMMEAKNQVDQMRKEFRTLKNSYTELSDAILSIVEAQNEYGNITDIKAMNALSLYASVMALNEKLHVNPDSSCRAAGYITYAYLAGENSVLNETESEEDVSVPQQKKAGRRI